MLRAYVEGLQARRLGSASVATMIKHFPYGREQIYPGGNLDYHLLPFEAAFDAGASQVMPHYGVPVGVGHEEVGFGFDRESLPDCCGRGTASTASSASALRARACGDAAQ